MIIRIYLVSSVDIIKFAYTDSRLKDSRRSNMREKNRVFGNNVKYLLSQRGISAEQFGKKLGYTEFEAYKIMDARLILDNQEKEDIRVFFGLDSIDELYVARDEAEYEQAGCIECRGSFDKSEDKKLILVILDLYCDVQEALAEIGE